MKKKELKEKLTLNKDTISNLNDIGMNQVKGGKNNKCPLGLTVGEYTCNAEGTCFCQS